MSRITSLLRHQKSSIGGKQPICFNRARRLFAEQLEPRTLLASVQSDTAELLPRDGVNLATAYIDEEVRAAVSAVKSNRSDGAGSEASKLIFHGKRVREVSLDVSASGQILVAAEFTPGDSMVVEKMVARGLDVTRSFPEFGLAELWVDEAGLATIAQLGVHVNVDLPSQATADVEQFLSESSGYKGTLTTRTSDTQGTIMISNVHGIMVSSTIDVFWSGGRRIGATVSSITPSGNMSFVAFSGGSGENLPALSSTITIDGAMKVQRALSQLIPKGFDGSGIKVGVMSTGDTNYAAAITAEELPANTVIVADPSNPSIIMHGSPGLAEGTAMMEIVNDIAPGAQLYFCGAGNSIDFATCITAFMNADVDIIVDDLSFLFERYFEDGPVATAAQTAVTSGIRYVTSAGNRGTQHYQAMSSMGGGSYHNFNPLGAADGALNIKVPGSPNFLAPFGFNALLQWSDGWGALTNSVNLELLNSNQSFMHTFAFSPNSNPFDIVTWYNAAAAPRNGNVTNGSTTISNILAGTTDLRVGMQIGGLGIPGGAMITSIPTSTSVTISSAATVTVTGGVLTFGNVSRTGNIANGSSTISNLSVSTTDLKVGMSVGGTGIPIGATISSINSGNSISISLPATSTITGVGINFHVDTVMSLRIGGPTTLNRELELFLRPLGAASPDAFKIDEAYASTYADDAFIAQKAIPGVIPVAAINAQNPGNTTVTNYSGHGPATIYTNPTTQTKVQRKIMSVAGIDQVHTWVGQSSPPPLDIGSIFTGTSAAAPSIAGVLALMLDAAGGFTAEVTGAPARTGNFSSGGSVISSLSVNSADLVTGMSVVGPGLAAGTRITGISNSTTILIEPAATSAGTGVTLAFGALAATATDLTPSGFDNTSGSGRANALEAAFRAYKPHTPDLLFTTDDGKSTGDNVTSQTSQIIRTCCVPAGSFIQLYRNGLPFMSQQLASTAQGQDFSFTAAQNSVNTYHMTVKSSSSAPDAYYSQRSDQLTIYTDAITTVTPPAPTMDASTDSGANDGYTNITNPKISATALLPNGSPAAFAWVEIYVDGALKTSGFANGSGVYLANTGTLTAGWHKVTTKTRMVPSAPSSAYFESPATDIFIDDGTAPVASIVDCQPGGASRTGAITNGQTTITNLSVGTSDLAPGMIVTGTGIQANTTILSVDSPNSITISQFATQTGSTSLSFSPCGVPGTILINFNKPVAWSNTVADLTMVRHDNGSVLSVTSATQFAGDLSFSTINNWYTGKTLRFTSGSLNGQAGQITGYTGSSRTFTFSSGTFTGPPSASDTFQIDTVTETGSVSSVTSATQFNGSSGFSTLDDYYIGRRVTFTSGALNGQQGRVFDYIGSTRTFIFQSSTFSGAPSVNDTFKLDANRMPISTSATIDSGYNPSQWLLYNFMDLNMSSGRYELSLKSSNSVTSLATGTAAGGAGPASWTQSDGAYQNGGKAEGPGGTTGVYLDVTADGFISSIDALTIINVINSGGTGSASAWCATHTCNPPYLDVNNDGNISASDSLAVLNYISAGLNPAPAAFSVVSPAALEPENVFATVQLQVTDLHGNPISSIKAGRKFQLQAILVLSAPPGVEAFAGYVDVSYTSSLVSPTRNPADVGLVGSTASGGVLNEVGRVMYGDSQPFLFTKTFTATKKGTASFNADVAELFGHEIYVTGLNEAVPLSQVTFGSTTLTIK